jgi:UDP-4-amino-4,6-dideoxy-N-acetyl-beta-L-altrosamine transaminase
MTGLRPLSYGRQCIEADDLLAVEEALRSDWLTQGPAVPRFEEALGALLGARHVTAVANGTAALHLTGLALGWKPGDLVLTVPLTFLASANCILYAGAEPGFVDVDPRTYTLCPDRLESRLKELTARGRRVKAVVAVDYAGHPCDWPALRSLADRYGFHLVADACHALGARYAGDAGYAAKYADCAVLSFHPVKHITTGEGGAVVCADPGVDEALKTLRCHGMTRDPGRLERNDGPWYYEMHALGFNYRITDLQCALGLSQLAKLDRFLGRRREIAAAYDRLFAGDDRFTVPWVAPGVDHAYHLYPLQADFVRSKRTRAEAFGFLKERQIHCQVHYIPVHLQPYYRKRFGFAPGLCPVAEAFYAREISIPMHPGLDEDDLVRVHRCLTQAIG